MLQTVEEELNRAYAAILDEARAHVAAGRDLNSQALEGRIRAAGQRERARDPARRTAIDQAEQRALRQLGAVATVRRARALMARQPAPSPATAAAPPRRATLRTRPTISGNMEVRRHSTGESVMLSWDAAAPVATWEVRFSERRDARADYAVRETLTLPAATTTVELPLSEYPLRVHLLGRSRDGRLLRRALISALTRETWNDRWQRRASAS